MQGPFDEGRREGRILPSTFTLQKPLDDIFGQDTVVVKNERQ